MEHLTPVLADASVLRQKIHAKAIDAIKSSFPLDLKGRKLEVEDLTVHTKEYSPEDQKKALLTGATLQEALKGTLILKDADGKVVDTAKDFTLTHLPYFTERHTVITDGNEYQIANQIRRKPGVYTQRADNGELHTIFNLGKGKNFDLGFNDKKGTFYLQYGATNIPMYPVLRALGVPHEDIAKHLGTGVARENKEAYGDKEENAIGKLYAKLEHPATMNPKAPHETKLEAVRKKFDATTLDPSVTQFTLGKEHSKVTPIALMDAAKKILDVHAGKDHPDDTDSLAFKTFHSVDTHFAERLKLTARQWSMKARMALQGKTNIREALRPAPFSESLRKFVTTSSLSAVPTGINPMELIDHAVKVTALGEGGIASDRAIPLDARLTHSTHFGAIDPIRTPESGHAGVDVRASIAAHRDDHGNLYTQVLDVKSGERTFLRAGDMLKHTIAFPNQPMSGEIDAFVRGEVQKIPAHKVEYQLEHVSHSLSPATTLIPMINNIQGNRAIMGSKMGTQALPLIGREAPYVQSKSHLPGDISFEEIYGHAINPTAPVAGTVKKIENGFIYIQPHAEKRAEDRPTLFTRKLGPHTFNIEHDRNGHPDGFGIMTSKANNWDYGNLPTHSGPDGDSLDFYLGDNHDGAIFCYEKQSVGSDGKWKTTDYKFVAGLTPSEEKKFDKKVQDYNKLGSTKRMLNKKSFGSWDALNKHIEQFSNEKTAAAKKSDDTGLIKVPYQTYFPFPSKTYLHHDLSVKPGDKVEAGQLLGNSNYTKNGTLALGKNLKVAYIGYHGLNSNDAVVISEGCSKKLTSEHMYREVYPVNSGTELNKAKHQMYFGTKYGPAQYNALDDSGVIKKGRTVNPKELIVAGLIKNTISGTDALLGRISKSLAKPYRELNLAWEHSTPGEVIDVVRSATQIAILVKTKESMQVGDKLCYDEKTEIFTLTGWKPVSEVTMYDNVATKINDQFVFELPSAVHKYTTGDTMYRLSSPGVDLFVTDSHKMYCMPIAEKEYRLIKARDILGKKVIYDLGWNEFLVNPEDPKVTEEIVKDYKGAVHGVTVTSGIVFVRRNGKTVWSGNSGRYGNKGVVSTIIPDHQMLKDEKGEPVDVLLTSAGVISRCYDEQTEFLTDSGWKFGKDIIDSDLFAAYDTKSNKCHFSEQKDKFYVSDYVGDLYKYQSDSLDFAVTPEHKMWGKPEDKDCEWRETTIESLYAHDWHVPSSAEFLPNAGDSYFELPLIERGSVKNTAYDDSVIKYPAKDWAALLGWYLAEGNTDYYPERSEYRVKISQKKSVNFEKWCEIDALLKRLNLKYHYGKTNFQFSIRGKRLAAYFKPFGLAHEKYIPEWIFKQSSEVRRAFLDAMWKGDGNVTYHEDGRISMKIGLVSKKLIDGIQRLMALDGYTVVVRSAKATTSPKHHLMHHASVYLSGAIRLAERHNWSKEPYAGKVYCPTVDTGYVLTRRNGKMLIAGNTNPAQVIETAVGKVAEKTGQPIFYDNNEHKNAVEWAKNLLAKHGVKDKETLYDPVTKRYIKGGDGEGVLVGRQYIYKLFKSTDTNFAGHGVGPYDINEQPLKTGGDEGAKSIAKMEFDALLAHNARNILKETATIRGQKNDEFWKSVQLGLPMPQPKVPFVYNKFVNMLEGAGIKVDKRGSKIHLLPMTDKDIVGKSAGAIQNNKTLIAKNLKPEDGGLFDIRLTGGPQGTLFSHINLHEAIPHPVFEEPIRRLMGWTQKEFTDKLKEKGGSWLKGELSKLDIEAKLKNLREKIVKAKGSELNDIIKQIKYLEALKKENIRPEDAYIISKVPVVPPVFRPVTPQPNDPSQLSISDANKLYAHLMDTNTVLKQTVLESDVGKHRQQLYNAVGAVFGTDDVENEELKGQAVKGFLSTIAGKGTPKAGFFQRKIMRRTQDVSGRGTAVPDGNLGMDEVGIPEQMLWQMYDKLVVARLVRQGYPALRARELVDKKDPVAKAALMDETKTRPVLINRAPTLHRWSIVASYPVPVQGKTIRVNPFIEKGFNLDYDGDTLQVHAPITQAAIDDAKEMTMSKLLLSDQQRNKLMAFPQHEAIIGFTLAAKHDKPTGPVHKFKTREEALAAYRRGELKLSDAIEIG